MSGWKETRPKAPGEAAGGSCAARSRRFGEEKPGTESPASFPPEQPTNTSDPTSPSLSGK